MIGFLNINKPTNISSAKIVAQIKNKLHIKKAGHMGTLDPMASGVLPIAIGKACRMFDYLNEKIKYYRATFTFGYETDTLDSYGAITHENGPIPTKMQINEILSSLIGKVSQMPPKYSAKKVNGQRAYDLARQNVDFELKPKEITIFDIKLVEQKQNNFVFDIQCSAGTYIRSICRDMAHMLDTFATMTSLIRTKSGYFELENSILVDNVTENDIISVEKVFSNYPKIFLDDDKSQKIKNGVGIFVNEIFDGNVFVYTNKTLFGVGKIINKTLKILINLYDN